MVRTFRDVREKEIILKIQQSSSLQVNLSELLASLTNDAFGQNYSRETNFKALRKRLTRLLGVFSVGSYVPWFAWIYWICSVDCQLEKWIRREVATWGPDAEEFRAEGHLDLSVDFRGQDFELIPFGAGRRICPEMSFVVVLNEVVLANLVHHFDWRLPIESSEVQTGFAESTASATHGMFPLYAIASSTS